MGKVVCHFLSGRLFRQGVLFVSVHLHRLFPFFSSSPLIYDADKRKNHISIYTLCCYHCTHVLVSQRHQQLCSKRVMTSYFLLCRSKLNSVIAGATRFKQRYTFSILSTAFSMLIVQQLVQTYLSPLSAAAITAVQSGTTDVWVNHGRQSDR